MKNVYIDTYGDILDQILNIPKDERIDDVLKGMLESADGEGVNLSDSPINEAKEIIEKKEKKKSTKKKTSKKSSKEEEKIRHVKVRRIK